MQILTLVVVQVGNGSLQAVWFELNLMSHKLVKSEVTQENKYEKIFFVKKLI